MPGKDRSWRSAYSLTVQWRKDRSLHYEGTGLAVIAGPDKRKPDDGVTLAKKLVNALQEGMLEQYEVWRGAQIEQEQDQNGKLVQRCGYKTPRAIR